MNIIKRIGKVLSEIFFIYIIFLIIFQALRIALWVYYKDIFYNINLTDFILISFSGARFDLASSSVLLFIPLFLIFLPFKFKRHLLYVKSLYILVYLIILGLLFFLISDFIYYSFVKRHITNELLFLINDLDYLKTEIFSNLLILIFFITISIFIFPFFMRLINIINPHKERSIIGFIVIILTMMVIGRGGFQMKPIAIIDAFQYGNGNTGNLILNGFFSASHYSVSSKFIERKIVNEEYYLDSLNIKSSQNQKYPLERNNKIVNDFTKKNLILIIVESLSYKYLDYFSKNNFAATPNLDKLSEEGLIFLNFFANGQRSVEGIQSILTGIPSLPGIPDITALSANYPKLGQIAENNGYKPIFITSTLRESFSLDLIAGASGFKEYYGKEDYPILLDYEYDVNRPLGWDYESLMFFFTLTKDNDKPIFSVFNASSNHTPFPKLHEPFNRYKHGTDTEGGYLNSLEYTDWSIGQFIREFKKREDFSNTLFIITADHALAHFQKNDPFERFRIPLIFYGPEIINNNVYTNYGSQIDLFPTIINILNFEGKYSAIGKILHLKETSYAIVKEGSLMRIFNSNGYLQHSLKRVLDHNLLNDNNNETYLKDMEDDLISYDHLAYFLLTNNRWISP